MSKTGLLILSEGAEEMEAVISIDVLRRAGIKVVVAGLQGANPTKCSRDVVIVPDMSIQDAAKQNYDVVILPGGLQGAESLSRSDIVKEILQAQEKNGRLIAAICAAPIALKSHSIGIGKAITSYPGKKAELSTGHLGIIGNPVGSLIVGTSKNQGYRKDGLVPSTDSAGEYQYLENRVVVSEQLITSRGPGTAFEFALAIVECLLGKEKATSLVAPMLINLPASS